MSETERIEAAAKVLRARGGARARVGLVLGSGLRDFAESLEGREEIAFSEVPHWPEPAVEGHGGSLILGEVGAVRVACLCGRVHLYEGYQPVEVVRPLRTLSLLGVETFVLTNAAGGLDAGWDPGTLMLISDHLNLTGRTPFLGRAEERLGPRFPDQSKVYAPELRRRAKSVDGELVEGVYAGLLGPSYETPAEVRMLQGLGADAVGMSTVLEAMALHAMGARILGISLISNLAAGLSEGPLEHGEVLAAGKQAAARLANLLVGFCEAVGS